MPRFVLLLLALLFLPFGEPVPIAIDSSTWAIAPGSSASVLLDQPNDRARLTFSPNAAAQRTAIWYKNAAFCADQFRVTFKFLFEPNPTVTPTDGLCFTLQNNPSGLNAIGNTSPMNLGVQGINQSIAWCIV